MSDDFTVGVEEEYQLVDAESGALCSRAPEVLLTDWTAEIRPELQETTLEIGTRVCTSAAELERDLKRLRFQVSTAAAALGLEIIAAGLHPFTRWEGQKVTRDERYRLIAERYGRIARDEHNFGMHIHVAVPPRRDRIRLQNVLRHFTPHLIALAASSPYFEGADTEYATYRMVLWRRWPGAGVPPRLESEREYERLIELLLRTGALGDKRHVYWSIRPHAIFPTLEFRMTDACPRLDDAVAIAALVRAMVAAAVEGVLREPRGASRFSAAASAMLLTVNEWRAIRFGLAACLVEPGAPDGLEPMRASIRRLVERVAPTAEALGDGAALAGIDAILERGSAAERMRRVACAAGRPGEGAIASDDRAIPAEDSAIRVGDEAIRSGDPAIRTGVLEQASAASVVDAFDGGTPEIDFATLIRWLVAETALGTGMDRRRAQRGRAA